MSYSREYQVFKKFKFGLTLESVQSLQVFCPFFSGRATSPSCRKIAVLKFFSIITKWSCNIQKKRQTTHTFLKMASRIHLEASKIRTRLGKILENLLSQKGTFVTNSSCCHSKPKPNNHRVHKSDKTYLALVSNYII